MKIWCTGVNLVLIQYPGIYIVSSSSMWCDIDTFVAGGIVNNTLRPPVPASCDPEWRRLMEQCWAPDPAQRPAFTEIAGRLRAMSVAANLDKGAK
jgi:hypothetical protein